VVAAVGSDAIMLRPHSHLFRQGILAILAFMTPVFVVLYVLTIPDDGPWPAVLVTQVLATVAVVFASASFFRVAIWVSSDGISEVGFFGGRKDYAIDQIGSVLRADVSDASSERPVPQLFVRGTDGQQLLRMRGQFWSRASMEAVVSTLGVPAEKLDETLSTSELRTDFPSLLYWFERRPVIAALVFTAATAVVGAIVFALFRLVP